MASMVKGWKGGKGGMNGGKGGSFPGICDWCGKTGHKKSQCRELDKVMEEVRAKEKGGGGKSDGGKGGWSRGQGGQYSGNNGGWKGGNGGGKSSWGRGGGWKGGYQGGGWGGKGGKGKGLSFLDEPYQWGAEEGYGWSAFAMLDEDEEEGFKTVAQQGSDHVPQ